MDYQDLRRGPIPEDLKNKTVLDLGGYDGKYDGGIAYLCKERGADVTIIDNGEYIDYGWGHPDTSQLSKDGIKFCIGDLMEWRTPSDIVLLYNVLYHLENPIGALRHCKALTKELFIIVTSFIATDNPSWRLYEEGETHYGHTEIAINNHYTVYFKPSPSGLVRALKRVGFTNIQEVGRVGDHISFVCS